MFPFFTTPAPPIIPEAKPKPKPIQHQGSPCRMHVHSRSRLGLHSAADAANVPFGRRSPGRAATLRFVENLQPAAKRPAGRPAAPRVSRECLGLRGGMRQQEHLRGVSLPCRDALLVLLPRHRHACDHSSLSPTTVRALDRAQSMAVSLSDASFTLCELS